MVFIRNIEINVVAYAGSVNIGKTINILVADRKKETDLPPIPSVPPTPPPTSPSPTVSCLKRN